MTSSFSPIKLNDTEVYSNVAKKLSIPQSEVEECMNAVIDWTHYKLRDMEAPAVRWPKFITFEMRPHKLKDEEVKELYRKYIEKDYGNYPKRYLSEWAFEHYEPKRPIKRIRTLKR
tara:strand:+ start:2693 stop:3040 length:348 start_codon:yes stop_codon:yes gene_type:complete